MFYFGTVIGIGLGFYPSSVGTLFMWLAQKNFMLLSK